MPYILLILFILLVVVPCVYIGYKVWRAYRRFNEFRNDPIGFFARQAQQDAERAASGFRKKQTRSKKISRDVGDYIEFTETVSSTTVDSSGSKTTFRREEQIQDIEWEDLGK